MKNKYLNLSFLTAAILFSLCLSAFDANAQTSKRRKKVRKTPVVAPPPVQPVATQNTGYIDGNQIVLGEIPQSPTTDETNGAETMTAPPTENTDNRDAQIKQLGDRLKSLEATGNKDEKQKRLLMNLDILTRAESRAESLRKQLFEIIEKQSATQARIEQIQVDSRSEVIDRNVAMMGSLRPEEIREQRRKSLEAEKRNLESLMTQIQTNRSTLETNVQKADALVEKVRTKLDREIDDALAEEDKP
ncbi:MAG: hypothetical protein LH472_05310 [Pyrinomonadaceae bacterium]|nr:hypothetical protein [Pyrinomonadaceae bacterium]